jgi:hypothetical protein
MPRCKDLRFSDFRMADDVQRNQQLIGLNAQGKVSDQTMLTELGYNFDHEVKKMIEEVFIQNYLNDLRSKGAAKAQGEAGLVQFNYQSKLQELTVKAQQSIQSRMGTQAALPGPDGAGSQPNWAQAQSGVQSQEQQGNDAVGPAQPAQPQAGGAQSMGGGQAGGQSASGMDPATMVRRWAVKLKTMDPSESVKILNDLKVKLPDLGAQVEMAMRGEGAAMAAAAPGGVGNPQSRASGAQPNMKPMPEKGTPTRAGT